MAYTTINKGSSYFGGATYLGSASAVTVSSLSFQPDLVWIKDRQNGNDHCLVDAVRGVGKYLGSNLTATEVNNTTQSISSFTSTGFVTGTANPANEATSNTLGFMSWNWLANNTSGSSNTSGTITSTVAANTTAGFSIVKYTGNGTGNSTIGHGLSAVPKFIIVKSRTSTDYWGTLSASFVSAADPNIVYLNITAAEADDTNVWGTSANFTSSTFTVGTWNGSNANATDYIAYCWSEIKGYSKFGKYTGNGSADGTFVYTGFKPAFLMVKETGNVNSWRMLDNKRSPFNVANKVLLANSATTEGSADHETDFLSNGFKLRSSDTNMNRSGGTYIYMAFAENPFVTSGGIPVTAR